MRPRVLAIGGVLCPDTDTTDQLRVCFCWLNFRVVLRRITAEEQISADCVATAAASPLTTNRFFNRPSFRGQREHAPAPAQPTVHPFQGTYRSWQRAKQGCSKNPDDIRCADR